MFQGVRWNQTLEKEHRLQAKFSRKEQAEIKSLSHDNTTADVNLHTTSHVATVPKAYHQHNRKRKQREDDLVEEEEEEERDTKDAEFEYSGLYTGFRYDHDGTLRKTQSSKSAMGRQQTPLKNSIYNTRYDLAVHGYENLPRPTTPLRVNYSENREKVFGKDVPTLTYETQRIVNRNLHPHDGSRTVSLTLYDTALRHRSTAQVQEDSWLYRSLRLRHTNIIVAIVHQGILKQDYPLASRAFAMLIRSGSSDIRMIWTVGLELLVWRREERDRIDTGYDNVHTLPTSSQSSEDEKFLNWLLVQFPALKGRRRQQVSGRDRAPQMLPALIMSKLRHNNPREALEMMQEKMLQTQYSEYPVYDAYCGIALMQMMVQESANSPTREQLGNQARAYFDDCIEKGGVLPQDLIDFEMSTLMKEFVSKPGSDSEDEGDDEEEVVVEGDETKKSSSPTPEIQPPSQDMKFEIESDYSD